MHNLKQFELKRPIRHITASRADEVKAYLDLLECDDDNLAAEFN